MDPAGEHLLAHAARTPEKLAVVMHVSGATREYGQLAARSGALARILRERGVRRG